MMEYPSGLDELDGLLWQAGRTHVIPPQEDPALLERLEDPRALARAKELLESGDAHVRGWAILAVERIGYALGDQDTAETLLAHAASARNKEEVARALSALQRLSPPEPLSGAALVPLIRHPHWSVWHEALRCVRLVPPAEVEPAVLERLDADRYGLVYVAYALRYLESKPSLRALELLLRDVPVVDVRTVAFASLAERLGAAALPYARRLAESRRIEEKLAAEAWLSEHGDADDVPFMAGRLERLLSSPRRRGYLPPEVSYLVPFLRRFPGPDAENALEKLRRRADRLDDYEREWLAANAPELVSGD